jgi:hypothetical protein
MDNKKDELERLKLECNRSKSELIKICDKMAVISFSEAGKLDRIIAKIESWQNSPITNKPRI